MMNELNEAPSPENEAALTTTVESGEFISVVRAVGDVDLNTVPQFKAALADASEAEDGIVLDMRAVSYMDSSGFAALLEAGRILRSTGGTLHLFGCSAGISRMMEITRLNTVFFLHETEADARKAVEEAAAAANAAVAEALSAA